MTTAPAMLQPWMTEMPTPPQPNTTHVDPGATFAVLMAAPTPVVTPHPMSEAMSNGTSSSILTAASCGTTSSSANVPVPAMPNRSVSPSLNFGIGDGELDHDAEVRLLWSTHATHLPHGGDQATTT